MTAAHDGVTLKSTLEYPRAAGVTVARLIRFARRVVRNFFANKGLLLAGAVGYNALLSMLPLSAVLLVVVSAFLDVDLILRIIEVELAVVLPGQADTLAGALRSFVAEREFVGGVGFAILLFFSSIAFRMLEDAMAIIFRHHEVKKPRHPVISALIPFVYIAAMAIVLFFVTLVTAIVQAHPIDKLTVFGRSVQIEEVSGWAFELLGFLSLVVALSSFYRVMPVAKVRLKLALIGGTVAAMMWEVVLRSVVWYFSNLSLVNVIYGSLATVVVVLLCMEIAAVIILLGAQVIAELEKSAEAGIPWWTPPPSRAERSF